MIYLNYINDKGETVKPLFHSGIVTGWEIKNDDAGVPETVVIHCKNNPVTQKKGTVYVWAFTQKIERITNWVNVHNFLKGLKSNEPKKATDNYKQTGLEL